MKYSWVYILSSKRNGTLYVGVTSDIIRRTYEHKLSLVNGFSKTYNIKQLVYYEQYEDITQAIEREKTLKKWLRSWKIELIEAFNPDWKDLYDEII